MRALLLVCSLTAACGSVTFRPLDGDAGVDGDPLTDAEVDATLDPPPPPPPPGTARELTVVGGASSDTRFRFEVEITGGVTGGAVTGASHTFTPAIAVTTPPGAN